MKRILTIQDISCIGKCSLTVALPIISAMGVETCVLPTAVLSTHTMFQGFTFHDLTSEIKPVCAHWKKENFHFDAIYTGYLGSFEQLDLMEKLFDEFGTTDTLKFVDPCMADNGNLYSGFTPDFATAMGKLCAKADVIVPNLTEASYLLGIPYKPSGYDKEYIIEILEKLAALGAKKVILKGVSYTNDQIGIETYDSVNNTYSQYFHEKVSESFHGTGDIYASVCVGALMRGFNLDEAIKLAADFVVAAIKKTVSHRNHNIYGVDFESCFPQLIKALEKE